MKNNTIQLLKKYNIVLQSQILELKSKILSNSIDLKEAVQECNKIDSTLSEIKNSIEWLNGLDGEYRDY